MTIKQQEATAISGLTANGGKKKKRPKFVFLFTSGDFGIKYN